MDVLSLIEAEPRGSDFHGLVERVAYKFYLERNPVEDNPKKNWSDAQRVVAEASYTWNHIFGDSHCYHRALECTADKIRKENGADPDTSWYMAQDYWANEVLRYVQRESLDRAA